MKLHCPHCNQIVDVPEHLAGQTTNCRLCNGPFTVPMLPPDIIHPPVLSEAAPPAATDSNVRPRPDEKDSLAESPTAGVPTAPTPPESTAPEAPQRRVALVVPLTALRWVAPAALVVLFVLLFFPWLGIYAGDTTLAEQSGMGVAFGSVSSTSGIAKATEVGSAGFVVLYFLVVLAGCAATIAFLVDTFAPSDVKKRVSHLLDRARPHRTVVFVGLAGGCFVLMAVYLLFSFPLESKMTEKDKSDSVFVEGLKRKLDGEVSSRVTSSDMVAGQWVQRRIWYRLSLLVSLAAAAAAFGEWSTQRGTRRWPRIEVVWA